MGNYSILQIALDVGHDVLPPLTTSNWIEWDSIVKDLLSHCKTALKDSQGKIIQSGRVKEESFTFFHLHIHSSLRPIARNCETLHGRNGHQLYKMLREHCLKSPQSKHHQQSLQSSKAKCESANEQIKKNKAKNGGPSNKSRDLSATQARLESAATKFNSMVPIMENVLEKISLEASSLIMMSDQSYTTTAHTEAASTTQQSALKPPTEGISKLPLGNIFNRTSDPKPWLTSSNWLKWSDQVRRLVSSYYPAKQILVGEVKEGNPLYDEQIDIDLHTLLWPFISPEVGNVLQHKVWKGSVLFQTTKTYFCGHLTKRISVKFATPQNSTTK